MEKLANLTPFDINNGVLVRMLATAGIPDVPAYVKSFHEETEEFIIEELEHSDPNKIENDEQIVPPEDLQHWIARFRPHPDATYQQPVFEPEQQQQQQRPNYGQSWIGDMRPYLDDSIQLPSQAQQQQQQQQMPNDIQSWIGGMRPYLDGSIQLPSEVQQQQQQQQQIPNDVQSWISGMRPRSDDSIQFPSEVKQQQQTSAPTDLKSWMHSTAPTGLANISDNNTTTTTTTTTTTSIDIPAGNLGTWLNDWSRSLAQQPPPTSLDNWLQSLVAKNVTEPITKANSPKGRLNSYLNAAQKVLSQHGYNISNEVTPPTNVKSSTGRFSNVKQMYFLWKILDKNNDHKITVEDVQIMFQEMGLGFLSQYVAQTLFEMVDANHDGTLQFRDFVALMGIIKQLISAKGSAKA